MNANRPCEPRQLLLVLLAATLSACSAPAPDAEDPGDVLARLGDREIHEADLEEWIRNDLYAEATRDKDPTALFEFRQRALDRMIDEQLIDAEMEKRGLDLEGLQREVAGSIEVSDGEVRTFFEQNRARMGDTPFEAIAPRIREFLTQQTRGQEWGRFVDRLREEAAIDVAMVAPRADVSTVGPALGPDDAPVTVVEFSDFNCPFCQRVNPTLKALRDRYPEQVRIVFRHFPLGMHPRAQPIAEAAACADEQDLFWPFHDLVFADGSEMADDAIRAAADSAGVELAAFDACLAAGRGREVVERDLAEGRSHGVTGTPAFFVNGLRLTGAQPLEAFVELIEQELAAEESGNGGEPEAS